MFRPSAVTQSKLVVALEEKVASSFKDLFLSRYVIWANIQHGVKKNDIYGMSRFSSNYSSILILNSLG